MPLYEYECEHCGHVFEHRHGINDDPVSLCPVCGGTVDQRVSGGSGFIIKAGHAGEAGSYGGGCSFENTGKTCCGRDVRCAEPQCEK